MKYDTPASAVVLHAEHSAPRGVLHVEHSILMGAAHRAPYSYRVLHTEHSTPTGVLHTEHSTPTWVLHTENSTLTGCCTQSTLPLQSAAHKAQCSHTGAGHGKQYSYSILTGCYTQNTVPLQSAPHRTQYSHRVLHMEQTTHTQVIHTEHSTPAIHPQEDTLQEFQAEISQSVTVTQWAV